MPAFPSVGEADVRLKPFRRVKRRDRMPSIRTPTFSQASGTRTEGKIAQESITSTRTNRSGPPETRCLRALSGADRRPPLRVGEPDGI